MLTDADLLAMHRRMLLIRGFEERVAALYRDGEVPGFVHLSIGQEASAVGACWPLGPADVITSTHRGHGHCLAKGLSPTEMFAELMAKEQGTNRGRGGSMHIADPHLGIFGANGIVAAGLPIAMGAATAAQLRADGGVAVAFFGDGAVAQGAFHEAVNLAAVWQSPVIFFCENNGYAEFSPASTQHAASLEQRAAGYGVHYVAVDGNDVVATASAMRDVVATSRAGGGPTIVEAATYRWHGHYEGDPQRYRTREEMDAGKRATRCSSTRVSFAHKASTTTPSTRWRHRWRASSTTHSTRRGTARARPRRPCPSTCCGRGPCSPSPPRRPTTHPCFAPWTQSTLPSRPSSRPTTGSS